jgi:PhnB protein
MSEGAAKLPAAAAKVQPFMRPGCNNIIPYLVVEGAKELIAFLRTAFEGKERLRVPLPDGSLMHAEVGIGNSVIELGDANAQHPPRPATIHVYVEDADAAYQRALGAGATSVYAVTDEHPSGDRQGCVKDKFGNVWYIAMVKGWTPGPEGALSVQPFLHLRDAHKMIPFAEEAFGADALGVAESEEGKILHATIRIGKATFEIDEGGEENPVMPCYLHLYVPETDVCYAAALHAGAVSVEPPCGKPYGERSATVQDPFGNTWFIATYLNAEIAGDGSRPEGGEAKTLGV